MPVKECPIYFRQNILGYNAPLLGTPGHWGVPVLAQYVYALLLNNLT